MIVRKLEFPETTTATAAEDEASEMLKPPRRSGTRNRTRENMISEDTVPESSRSGVSGAEVDHTIITLIVAAVIVAVLVVVVKKNWSKIRAKFGREQQIIEPIPLNQQQKQIRPEEVPLQNKNTV